MTEKITRLLVDIPPVVASRPRVARWGVYYGKLYKQYMKDCERVIKEAEYQHEGNLACTLDLVCHKPKTTKRSNPRGDIDNYAKAILDALTKKGYWIDDDQIVELHVVKRFIKDGEKPHTYITIRRES